MTQEQAAAAADLPAFGFGTAHLYGLVAPAASDRLIAAALAAGITRLDTAPSYGFGAAEPAVGRLRGEAFVTTKVGLEPARRPGRGRRTAVRALGPLAGPLLSLRGRTAAREPATYTGRFELGAVRASVERSLQRLGRIDRLLLHEVAPADIDAPLLAVLERWLRDGDVGSVGVATAGGLTAAALARGQGVLAAAQYAIGPSAPPVALPIRPDAIVGHGLFGPAGRDLQLLRQRLRRSASLRSRWEAATAGSAWSGDRGLATALVHRAHRLGVDEVVVATSRVENMPVPAELHLTAREVTPEQWRLLGELTRVGAA